MLKIDKKVWLYLLLYIIILVVSALVLKGKVDSLVKIGLSQGIALVALVLLFSSRKLVIGLGPNFKVSNFKYIVPLFIILLMYALIRTDFLNYQENSFLFICYVLFIIFIQTLTEEMVFRGLVLNNYLKKGLNVHQAVIYSSVIFGLFHFVAIFGKTPVESIVNQVLMAIMCGIFLGAIFVLTRNIYLTGLMHLLINIPSYFNSNSKVEKNTDVNLDLYSDPSFLEMVLSTSMIVLIYSPFLIVGLFLLSKARKAFENNPL